MYIGIVGVMAATGLTFAVTSAVVDSSQPYINRKQQGHNSKFNNYTDTPTELTYEPNILSLLTFTTTGTDTAGMTTGKQVIINRLIVYNRLIFSISINRLCRYEW